MANPFSKIFGSRNQRLIKRMRKTVSKINALEAELHALPDDALKAKTDEFKARLDKGEKLNALLIEAFAVVREVAVRTLKMRHFDVQLIGGMVLHSGKITEMRTGEGKTLVATLPAYLNALSGESVHVITVNDYLAKRDAEWMRPIYDFLGLTVGINLPNMSFEDKKAAYACDITYGTNNEFGFDYLRDNMAFDMEGRVQRKLNYAVLDEVDSILIDEARTPLIISGPAEEGSELYTKMNQLVPKLKKAEKIIEAGEEKDGPGDYSVDEKTKQAFLTDEGHATVENMLIKDGVLQEGDSLYDLANLTIMHHLNAALRAHALFQRNVDYIVKDNQIIIVDEHTGRVMEGRRWSDGLHQAIEAKERVPIQAENQTLASITFQNYFRLYEKLSGMTGTADTEAYEFQQIYGLEVVIVPTNKPMIRQDMSDQVYLTTQAKYSAIINSIKERRDAGQPILVGTTSIESSELVSKLLKQENIAHQVLNAKFHEQEAKIIAEAGRPGNVTIATNMAGRGTDIVLGGNFEVELAALDNPSEQQTLELKNDWQARHDRVIAAGGLYVLGTERNESRRIDNQLRGRSGRQGDPGLSRFYLSLEDNLMRVFGSERISALMQRFGMQESEAIENKIVTRAIENVQRKVEGHNYDMRKQLLEYDDVANDQRRVVYAQRLNYMQTTDLSAQLAEMRKKVVNQVIDEYIPPESLEEQWDVSGLEKQLQSDFNCALPLSQWLDEDDQLHEELLRKRVFDEIFAAYKNKIKDIDPTDLHNVEKSIMLQSLDAHWKEHLASMDHLRQGIHLRSYAQRNPVQEYKRESFEMFTGMLDDIERDVISTLSLVQFQTASQDMLEQQQRSVDALNQLQFNHTELNQFAEIEGTGGEAPEKMGAAPAQPFVRQQPKVGRNQPCPCGSGKKFKQCHGKITA